MKRILIKTGVHAGKTVMSVECNARPFPSSEENNWDKYKDGVWIEEFGIRLQKEIDPSKSKHCGDTVHYEDLVIPFDKFGKEIFVGDMLYVAADKGVIRFKVEKIGVPYLVGCGWMQRTLHGIDIDTGKRTKTCFPSKSIKA